MAGLDRAALYGASGCCGKVAGAGMTIATVKLTELRIVWIAEANGLLRMTWAEETFFVGLNDMKARGYGR
jgi:hypothetical protein